MDLELAVTFEKKKKKGKDLGVALDSVKKSQNIMEDFTIEMFSLTGEGGKEMEIILISARESH